MNTRLYSVYDKAAERYLDPFCAPTDSVAIRGFSDAVNREGHPFNLHPEDYTLVYVGEFDGANAIIDIDYALCTLVAGYQVQKKPDRFESVINQSGPVKPVDLEEESDAN